MDRKKIILAIGVVALGGVAYVGYRIWKKKKDKKTSNFFNVVGRVDNEK